MQINIKTSSANQEVVTRLTQKLASGTKENVIARIALAYSLATGRRFTKSEFGSYDSGGKEYKDHVLFDEQYRDFYIAMICQAYGIGKNDDALPRYVKLHVDHGLEKIERLFEANPRYTFFDFLTEHLTRGIDALEDAPVGLSSVANNNQHITKGEFVGPIKIKVGYMGDERRPVFCNFNDAVAYANQHVAVAGKSGSGKTQFALEFLRQLYEQTQGRVNFLFVDFKGISDSDKQRMAGFFATTQTECICAPQSPFPLNPVSFIDNVNEKNRLMGINKLVDIIGQYADLGQVQRGALKSATEKAFLQRNDGRHPSLKDIGRIIAEEAGDKKDRLTDVMSRLSEYEIFSVEADDPSLFLNKNHYLSLSGELDNTVRFTATFLIINYIFNVFSNMGATDVVDGNRAMRYVLMIDEAHDLFRNKRSLEILEVMLRKMRSYGVSIVLLSQGISEYNQGSFDFSQGCETAFLLPINDLANVRAIGKFLGLAPNDAKAMRNIERLDNGLCVSNIKELPKAELFEIAQYWKETVAK